MRRRRRIMIGIDQGFVLSQFLNFPRCLYTYIMITFYFVVLFRFLNVTVEVAASVKLTKDFNVDSLRLLQ